MGRAFKLLLLLFIIFLIPACAYHNEEPDIIGYVMGKPSDDSFVVVSKEAQDFSTDGGLEEYYDAVQLEGSPSAVQVGQQVKVWYSGDVAESYPLQAKVGKVEIIPPTKAKEANMTETDALAKALKEQMELVAVRSITYDQILNIWEFEFVEILDGDHYMVEIKD